MKVHARKLNCILISMITVFLLSAFAAAQDIDFDDEGLGEEGVDFIRLFNLDARLEPLYHLQLQTWEEEGYAHVEDFRLEIPGAQYTDYYGETPPEVVSTFEGRDGDILLWEEEDSIVTWEVHVPQTGLYWIAFGYHPLPGRRASAMRDFKINGEYPFNEARRINFERVWVDEHLPKQDNQGNDIRPKQIEKPEWRFKHVEDSDGMYLYPFSFLLEEGVNTIEVHSIREPMAISHIVVESRKQLPTYEDVRAEYEAEGYKEIQDVFIQIDAETPVKKSAPTVRAEFGSDPYIDPRAGGFWKLNAFGSDRWRTGGEWAEWSFTVPEAGLYQIVIKRSQSQRMPSVREIKIDGEIPFLELAEFPFHYDKHWTNTIISDPRTAYSENEVEPFLFYLDAGEHTMSMRVKIGRGSETIRLLDRVTKELAGMARAITYLVGPNPDPYMEWEIHKRIPELLPLMAKIREDLLTEADRLRDYAQTRIDLAESFKLVADQLASMMRDPYKLHNRIGEFSEIQSQLAHYLLDLRYAPLTLDYMLVTSLGAELPQPKANFLERLWYEVLGFAESFTKDYDQVGDVYEADEALDLWVAWGREWALIIKEMIEEDFTPETGIPVNVNVIPKTAAAATGASLVLLSAASGNSPDALFGAEPQMPVEFAIRGGVADLSQYEGFDEVLERFRDQMLIPFTYQDKVYALPETQSFRMMFYRIDIMEEIEKETGVAAPETWDEVLEILPSLQQRGMNFNYTHGPGGFSPFLFQHGANYYSEDGLRSALDTPEALQAFRFWTELYANYKVDIESNFYNRMRTGEMPIGIADYFTYVLLSTAAPELTGWWRMVPIPGIRQPDGSIDRSAGGESTAAVIFEDSDRKEDAWKLLKWWTSTEIQTRYAEELEALLGVEARWNTSNVHAFQNLPWPKPDIEAILTQWDWFQEKPVVLGDYFTTRHIEFAWNMAVVDGRNARESLEMAIEQINRELIRKQEEFGIQIDDQLRRDLYRGYSR